MKRFALLLLALSLVACATGTSSGPEQPLSMRQSPDACPEGDGLPPDARPPQMIQAPQPPTPRTGPLEGYACLEVTIDIEGRVSDPEILATNNGDFGEALVRIAPTWRFEPASRDGEPVEVRYVVFSGYRRR